jgi:hypothetical protein
MSRKVCGGLGRNRNPTSSSWKLVFLQLICAYDRALRPSEHLAAAEDRWPISNLVNWLV